MTPPRPARPARLPRSLAGLALLAVLGATAVGCAAGGSGGDDASDTSVSAASGKQSQGERFDDADQSRTAVDGLSNLAESADLNSVSARRPVSEVAPDDRSLVKQGAVALRSDDVDQAKADVLEVMDRARGEVASDDTKADDDGDAERVRLTLRVPVDEFDATLTGLGGVAELVSTSTTSEDVTTQVIDTDVRVQLQRRSLERIGVLLDRAQSIRDVVAIERQLTSRQAALDSLEKRQAFLADQTSLATIAVSIQRTPEKQATTTRKGEAEGSGSGFGTGLHNGWDAFTGVTVGLLTALGAVLPFGVVLLVLGLPLSMFLRRRRAAADAPEPATT